MTPDPDAGYPAICYEFRVAFHDGENGRLRPFLVHDLEPLRAAPVRRGQASRAPRAEPQ
jgi:hypothetical protein